MSYTYNPSQTTPLDRIRFLLQDTCDPPELQDEEIVAEYERTDTQNAAESRILSTAYQLAMILYRKYAQLTTVSSSGESIQYTQRAQEWYKAANTLKEQVQPWSQVVQGARRYELWTDYQDPQYPRSREVL